MKWKEILILIFHLWRIRQRYYEFEQPEEEHNSLFGYSKRIASIAPQLMCVVRKRVDKSQTLKPIIQSVFALAKAITKAMKNKGLLISYIVITDVDYYRLRKLVFSMCSLNIRWTERICWKSCNWPRIIWDGFSSCEMATNARHLQFVVICNHPSTNWKEISILCWIKVFRL